MHNPIEITAICRRVLNINAKGVLGCCGASAVAMNHVLFGGRGRYFVMADRALCKRECRWVGHVAVQYKGMLYDARGIFTWCDYRDWLRMLSVHDRFGSRLPKMPSPRQIVVAFGDALCFWAGERDVRRAFVRTSSQRVPPLERLFREVIADPKLGRYPRRWRAWGDRACRRRRVLRKRRTGRRAKTHRAARALKREAA